MPARRPLKRTHLLVSFAAAMALSVPLAYLARPWVQRQVRVSRLTNDDPAIRHQGLNHLALNAAADDQLRAAGVKALSVEDEANFLQIVDALQAAGCWHRPDVPDEAWLRWIGTLADEPGIEGPARAVQLLADLRNIADHPRLTGRLATLSRHNEADVRYNALCTAAELCQYANDPSPYHALMREAARDDQAVIAHHASIFAYLHNVPDAARPAWLEDLPTEFDYPAYELQAIRNLLLSPEAPLRDVGCILATRDLDSPAQDALIEELIRSDPTARFTAAMLAGVSGRQNRLLASELEQQTDWVTASGIKLGMWMQGEGPFGEIIPSGYLARDDMPRSSVLMAMLSKPDGYAYEALLNPRGEPPADLIPLLEDYGWWRVLNHYLLNDAPRWVPTDDPVLQQNQVDLLRDWYLIHRRDILNIHTRITY